MKKDGRIEKYKMDQREKTGQEKKSRRGHGCLCCVCCIRTAVWNISDMKKEGRI
jgi:hypothetical protein